jgi:hypothetical protein
MSESNREWSIAEVTFGEVPPIPTVKVEVSPLPVAQPVGSANARTDLRDAVEAWSERHGFSVDDVCFETNTEGNLSVVLEGLTLDEHGDIVQNQREYEWYATITIEVQVSGTVTATDEDDAHDKADEAVGDIDLDGVQLDGYGVDGFDVEGYGIETYEVIRITEQ